MKFKVKEVMIKKDKVFKIYTPMKIPMQLTAIDPIGWDKVILANSIGYEFLIKVFTLASKLKYRELIYIPTNPLKKNEYKNFFEFGIFDLDIVLINYHEVQLKDKEIFRIIKEERVLKNYIKEIIIEDLDIEYLEYWLIDRKLSTKRFKNTMIISTNRDVFMHLAKDSEKMTGEKDNEDYNFNSHIHEDSIGTSEYNGFNFFYYHRKENI